MKQILQNLKSGETFVNDVPCPKVKSGCLLIQSVNSLISAGTERMLVDFGKAGWIDKARQQPDKVKQAIQKVKTDGLGPTLQTIQTKLDQPQPLGYSNAGIVLEVGAGVNDFKVGDRVISNGRHAEVVCVPTNLCSKIPENVSFEQAAFAVVSSIGLQGIRLLNPTLGEKIVVIGLGLIGQLTVQMLRANGCEVMGIDLDPSKCAIAEKYGAKVVKIGDGEDPLSAARNFTNGKGVDGVVITAKSSSNDIVHQAADMSRKRGRIILVGVVGLELRRSDFYEKELSFQVSCSYGPGRYDPDYEEKGQDYPLPFVRWTEQRNFDAVLGMMEEGKLLVDELITHRFKIEEAQSAYDAVSDGVGTGIILKYTEVRCEQITNSNIVLSPPNIKKVDQVCVGLIGAGNFTGQRILPALSKLNVKLKTIVSAQGVSGTHLGKKYGFESSSTDPDEIFNDPDIDIVFVTTRPNSHANFVIKALKNKKHVFVEKPLALKIEEISLIENLCIKLGSNCPMITVGFNRRFSPHSREVKKLLTSSKDPKAIIYTVNSGYIPADNWVHDITIGGGRIAGEGCHFIDLCRYFVGHPIVKSEIQYLGGESSATKDTATISLSFEDGSVAAIHYYSNGHKGFSKERIEVFCDGKILEIDNFRTTKSYGWTKFKKFKSSAQAKGHNEEISAVIDTINGRQPTPISLAEIFEVSKHTIKLARD